jgi:hypothetical protein
MKKIYSFLLLLLVSTESVLAQCAMCKASLEAEINSGGIGSNGINDGILYLMFIPYLLIGGVGFMMYKHFKSS